MNKAFGALYFFLGFSFALAFPTQAQETFKFKDKYFFAHHTEKYGTEIWVRHDSITSDSLLFKDICPGKCDAMTDLTPVVYEDFFFFIAISPAFGSELWVTNGTRKGTRIFKDIIPGPKSSSPSNLSLSGHTLTFEANDPESTGDRKKYSIYLQRRNSAPIVLDTIAFEMLPPKSGESLLVGSLEAVDINDDPISYRIVEGNRGAYFGIDPFGNLFVFEDAEFIEEDFPFNLKVRVKDHALKPISKTILVTVRLSHSSEMNFVKPWASFSYIPHKKEDSPTGGGPISDLSQDSAVQTSGHFGRGILAFDSYQRWKNKISKDIGLDYTLNISPIYQYGIQSGKSTGNSEQDFIGEWRALQKESHSGKFVWWLVHFYNFTELYTYEFSAAENLTLETNFGSIPEENFKGIAVLWWEHSFMNNHVTYRMGQLFTNLLWGYNKYIDDDRLSFMNTISSTPMGSIWSTQTGLGAQLVYQRDAWYLAGGFNDHAAPLGHVDFETFGKGLYTYHGEFAITPSIHNNQDGKYSINYSYAAKDMFGEAGGSIVANIRQDMGISGHYGLFRRYIQQLDKRYISPFIRTATAGASLNGVGRWTEDRVAVAYVYGEPLPNAANQNDHGIETYYKAQLTKRGSFTLDAQYYFETSLSKPNQSSIVLSGRLRWVF